MAAERLAPKQINNLRQLVSNSGAHAQVPGAHPDRSMIQERDILRCEDGKVSFQYRDAKTARMGMRTLDGADFLWPVLQHVLPKGLRRSRNFGFLHPNSARSIRLLQVLLLRAAPRRAPKLCRRRHGPPGTAPAASPCTSCVGAWQHYSLMPVAGHSRRA